MKFTTESKSRLSSDLNAAVNGGRLKAYASDASLEHTKSWRQIELARVGYRASGQINFTSIRPMATTTTWSASPWRWLPATKESSRPASRVGVSRY